MLDAKFIMEELNKHKLCSGSAKDIWDRTEFLKMLRNYISDNLTKDDLEDANQAVTQSIVNMLVLFTAINDAPMPTRSRYLFPIYVYILETLCVEDGRFRIKRIDTSSEDECKAVEASEVLYISLHEAILDLPIRYIRKCEFLNANRLCYIDIMEYLDTTLYEDCISGLYYAPCESRQNKTIMGPDMPRAREIMRNKEKVYEIYNYIICKNHLQKKKEEE